MGIQIISPPEVEPVSVAEVMEYLRVDVDDSSNADVVSSLALSARQWCEEYTKTKFITQTLRYSLDWWPDPWKLVLPYAPVQSISTFRYLNGDYSTFTEIANYQKDLYSTPARLTPLFGQPWPYFLPLVNALQVEYVVGYGDTADKVPQPIKTAIALLVSHWYENRVPDQNSIPKAVKVLLSVCRNPKLC